MGAILSPKNGYLDYQNGVFEDDVQIYMILGQRSDGKTYGIIKDSIDGYAADGTPSAYIRRFDESLKSTTVIRDLCKPREKSGRVVSTLDGGFSSRRTVTMTKRSSTTIRFYSVMRLTRGRILRARTPVDSGTLFLMNTFPRRNIYLTNTRFLKTCCRLFCEIVMVRGL